jgi:predicted dinucleotide-binding enzyme
MIRRPFSSRHPEELKGLVAGLGSLAQAGTVAQAIAFGEALFVAVPYKALPQLGESLEASAGGLFFRAMTNSYPL